MSRLTIGAVLAVLAAGVGQAAVSPAEEAGLFTAGVPVAFAVDQAGGWRVLDVDGARVREGRLEAAGRLEVSGLPVGYYELEVGGERQSFVVCPADRALRNPRLGVNVTHITHLMGEGPEPALRVLRVSRRLGFAWVRHPFTWEDIHTGLGGFRWGVADLLTAECERLGLAMLPCIFYSPPWASTAPESQAEQRRHYMPQPEALAEFCEAAAKRYKGRVEAWEFWNEPDVELFWKGRFGHTTSDEILGDLVESLGVAYTALKRGDPEARLVAFGATGGLPEGGVYRPFLKTVLEKGAGRYFDAISVHYGADLAACRGLLKEAGASTEIWITELGGGDDESRSGGPVGHVREDIAQAVWQWAQGAERLAKFFAWPIGIDTDMSLFRAGGTPKPAAAGWAIFNDVMREARCVGELDVVRSVDRGFARGVGFETPEGPLAVVWLEHAKRARCELPVGPGEVTVMDALGRPAAVSKDDGKIGFELGLLPVYVRGKVTAAVGEVAYPKVVIEYVDERVEKLECGDFEGSSEAVFAHWQASSDVNKPTAELAFGVEKEGASEQVLSVAATEMTNWPCVQQVLPVRQIDRMPEENARLVYRVTGRVRTKDVVGRGAFVEISYLDGKGDRIWPPTSSEFRIGSSEWVAANTAWSSPQSATVAVAVRCYLGRATGQAWFDDLELRSAIEVRRLEFAEDKR
ncbi:MAG: hypothetical protein GXY33_10290 [Phycisphaerae bacterium]|nr:hypothetical protein [Phycisphaerae bacterium]